jgi:hypothetical protein
MGMIHTLKIFIKAKIYAVNEILPFFAATMHNLYLISAYTYLQRQTLEM